MGKYIIDNNVISHYFDESFSENGMIFIGEILDETPIISVITEIEALSWISTDKIKETKVKEFISESIILQLNQRVVNKCIAIRRSRKIKTPDAIIAATAIVNNLILLSNDSVFSKIPGLSVIDPFKI